MPKQERAQKSKPKTANLLIVEARPFSPVELYRDLLPSTYKVFPIFGDLLDWSASRAALPKEYKKASWVDVGVHPITLEPLFVVTDPNKEAFERIQSSLDCAKSVLLATDCTPQGELNALYLLEALKRHRPELSFKRVILSDMTREGIRAALNKSGGIDYNLAYSHKARRIIDRLIDYELGRALSKHISGAPISHLRRLAPALNLLVRREKDLSDFNPKNQYVISVILQVGAERLKLALCKSHETACADGEGFTEDEANQVFRALSNGAVLRVVSVDEMRIIENAPPPFKTTDLLREANSRLGYSVYSSLALLQELYLRGCINYPITDSEQLSPFAVSEARAFAAKVYGEHLLKPNSPGRASANGHLLRCEAIRPTRMVPSSELKLKGALAQFYDLVLYRTAFSQVKDSVRKTIFLELAIEDIDGLELEVKLEPPFGTASCPAPSAPATFAQQVAFRVGDELKYSDVSLMPSKVKPSRYTHVSLEAELVELVFDQSTGTYMHIVNDLVSSGYAENRGGLVPTPTAYAVVELLKEHFPAILGRQFTADIEQQLAQVAAGKITWQQAVKNFFDGNGKCAIKQAAASLRALRVLNPI